MNTDQVTTEYKKLQNGIFESTRRLWLAGLGTLSVVEEESTGIFDQLIEKGRLVEQKSRKQVNRSKAEIESGTEELAEELSDRLDRQVASVLQKLGIPSRAQVQDLTLRVEQLSEQVDRMTSPTAAKKTAAPAKAAKKTAAPAKAAKTTKASAKA